MWRVTQSTPFTPWPNTVAYFPLREDASDVTGNYTLINQNIVFTTEDGVKCGGFWWYGNKLYTLEDMQFTWNDAFTISMWIKDNWALSWYFAFGQPPAEVDPYWQAVVWWNRAIWLYQNGYSLYRWCRWNDERITNNPQWVWTNYIFSFNGIHLDLYMFTRNEVHSLTSNNYDIQSWPLVLWSDLVDWAVLQWYMNEVIIEDKAWTRQEARDYFNASCTEYWYLPVN